MVSSGLCHSVLHMNGTSSKDSPNTLELPQPVLTLSSVSGLSPLCQVWVGKEGAFPQGISKSNSLGSSGRWWSDSPGVWGNNSVSCKHKARSHNSSVTKPAAGVEGLDPVGGAGLLSQVSGCVEASSPVFSCQLLPGGR